MLSSRVKGSPGGRRWWELRGCRPYMWAASSASPGIASRWTDGAIAYSWRERAHPGCAGLVCPRAHNGVLNRQPRQNRWTGPSLKQAKVPEAVVSQIITVAADPYRSGVGLHSPLAPGYVVAPVPGRCEQHRNMDRSVTPPGCARILILWSPAQLLGSAALRGGAAEVL